jgi:dTDP-4-amino-4,6-dideoxygalactose transaminase
MILMNNFRAEPEELLLQELAACEQVLRSGWYILGNEVRNFETKWAAACGARRAVGTGNGMDAIEIGLRAIGIGQGDEIITTPMTAFATILAILRTGATPVLADINPMTGLLDPVSARRCITPHTKAVLLVHLYGQICDMEQWQTLSKDTGIVLVEDCAQAHLARWNGKMAGTFGAFGAYSFYPTKNLGCMGDGGAIITNSDDIAEHANVLRNYGQSERYHHPELGMNSRLDEMQAALLSIRMGWLEGFTARRREIAHAYNEQILNPLIELLAKPSETENHVYHLYVVKCAERERLVKYMKDSSIATLIHYPVPVHWQEPCREVRTDPVGIKNSESYATLCLSIPCHPQMNDCDVAYVIEVLNGFR